MQKLRLFFFSEDWKWGRRPVFSAMSNRSRNSCERREFYISIRHWKRIASKPSTSEVLKQNAMHPARTCDLEQRIKSDVWILAHIFCWSIPDTKHGILTIDPLMPRIKYCLPRLVPIYVGWRAHNTSRQRTTCTTNCRSSCVQGLRCLGGKHFISKPRVNDTWAWITGMPMNFIYSVCSPFCNCRAGD